MSARAALDPILRHAQCFSLAGRVGFQAQPLEGVLQITFVQLSDAPELKIHEANRGRLTQRLNLGGVFGNALLQ